MSCGATTAMRLLRNEPGLALVTTQLQSPPRPGRGRGPCAPPSPLDPNGKSSWKKRLSRSVLNRPPASSKDIDSNPGSRISTFT